MTRTNPDHLVITAPTLEEGVSWVEGALGVSLSPRQGGEHDRQGTHNTLLSLGPDFYLEVIAVNPTAPAPTHRWFGMDNVAPEPRLAHWVCATTDLEAALAAVDPVVRPGEIEQMSRPGLQWLITIAGDGQLAADGAMPSLIQWQSTPHPASRLREQGCRLECLEVIHPLAHEIEQSLKRAGYVGDGKIVIKKGETRIVASISTPNGIRTLG